MLLRSWQITSLCVLALAAFTVPGVASGGMPKIWFSSTPASSITATSVRIAAIVKSDTPSTFHVEIGHTSAYGFTTTEHANRVSGASVVWVTIYGLAPSTTYHFRVVATNSEGTRTGDDGSFTTLAAAGTPAPELLTEVAPTAAIIAPAVPPPSGADPLAVPDLAPPLDPANDQRDSGDSGAAAVLLPAASRTVVAEPVSGSVTVRPPAGSSFTGLSSAHQIPVGSIVDARHGVLEISADTGSTVDTGRFWGAVFRVGQPTGAGGVTELTLVGGRPARCARRGATARAAAAKKVGGLWGKDHKGRFRTRGRNSVATVRGTVWYVAERCAGTLTRVIEGAVAVRDTRRGRTVVVKAGGHVMVRDRARSASRSG